MTLLFGLDVIPLGIVSSVLVVLQGTVVGSWCFCLATAAISLVLVYWAYDEVWSCLLYLRREWKRTRDIRLSRRYSSRKRPVARPRASRLSWGGNGVARPLCHPKVVKN